MEEFFARLKQHKLVQWALAYIAVSFGLIPVTDVIAQQFGWPEAVRRGVIIALATGFFITLVLAWYHGERGHGQIIRSELGILSVLVALGLVAIWRIAPTTPVPVTGEALAHPAVAAPAVIPQKSVAVLPLTNGSGNQDEQYFSDGLSEDLITALSQFAGLKVISRDSAFQFRHSTDSSKVIGEKLGVAHLLEGSVRRAGDEVRISAELVNAANGSTLWSEHYDRPYKDLFKLQDDITKAVADALKAKLLSSPSAVVQSDRPPSGNLAAYNAYLQGNAYFATGGTESFHQAIAAYATATHLDPHYARAFAALSYTWINLANNSGLAGAEQRQAYTQARSAADTALALDPNSAAAHSARGNLLKYADFDLPGAEAAYRRALQLAPNDAQAKYFLGGLLAELGQPESAVELTRQALASDPRHASWYIWLSQYLGTLGRLDEAEHAARTAIALQPGAADLHEQLTIVEILRGDAKAAQAAAKQEVTADGWREIALALAQQISGDPAAADAALKQLIDHQADGSAYQIAQVYALRRDPNHMFHWLDRAWASRDAGISYLLYDPFILRYKDDPRFAALCKKVGLPVPGAIDATAAPP